MNIFFLDEDPVLAARYMVNRHVVKMVSESYQMLAVANGITDGYKNHPCSIWARENSANYKWLLKHGLAIGDEYKFRYGKTHKTYLKILQLDSQYIYDIPYSCSITTPALAMPDDCKDSNPVTAYRNYYQKYKNHLFFLKSGKHTWNPREVPHWINLEGL